MGVEGQDPSRQLTPSRTTVVLGVVVVVGALSLLTAGAVVVGSVLGANRDLGAVLVVVAYLLVGLLVPVGVAWRAMDAGRLSPLEAVFRAAALVVFVHVLLLPFGVLVIGGM